MIDQEQFTSPDGGVKRELFPAPVITTDDLDPEIRATDQWVPRILAAVPRR